MPAPPLPYGTLVAMAAERISRLLRAGDRDPPLPHGGTPAEWALAAGLGCAPHAAITDPPLDIAPHDAESLALVACRRLTQRGELQHQRGRYMRRPR